MLVLPRRFLEMRGRGQTASSTKSVQVPQHWIFIRYDGKQPLCRPPLLEVSECWLRLLVLDTVKCNGSWISEKPGL